MTGAVACGVTSRLCGAGPLPRAPWGVLTEPVADGIR